jgi:DNA-binding LacI/PurR family transcriptional regulator
MSSPEPPGLPITLRDIARTLRVSHVTVSLALRNNPQIPPARCAQIQQAALRMGYRPNAAAAALALHKQRHATPRVQAALAWLNHWPQPRKLRRYLEFDRYWRGAYAAAEKYGYRLEEFVCGRRLSLPRLETVLFARGIRGILLPPHPVGVQWTGFSWDHFSAMRFGRSIPAPRLHVVSSDQVANAMLAFREMRQRGYTRIGLVTGRAAERGALHKAGFMMAQEWVAPALRLPLLTIDDRDLSAGQRHLHRWLRDTRPDAILSDMAEARAMLEEIGCRVPDDVGLAALSIVDGCAAAGIDQHPDEIGWVAVLLVLSLMNDGVQGVPAIFRQILVEGSWVDGDTLPRRQDSSAMIDEKEASGETSRAPRRATKTSSSHMRRGSKT